MQPGFQGLIQLGSLVIPIIFTCYNICNAESNGLSDALALKWPTRTGSCGFALQATDLHVDEGPVYLKVGNLPVIVLQPWRLSPHRH